MAPKSKAVISTAQQSSLDAIKALSATTVYRPIESQRTLELRQEQTDWDNENERLSLENRREKRDVRRRWNNILTLLVVFGFFFSYAFVTLVGFGVMTFDSSIVVPSVVAAGAIETYGLAKLAIKYFFSDDGETRTLKAR